MPNPKKTSYRIFHSGLVSNVLTWKLEWNIEIGEHIKKCDKTNKMSKILQLQKKLEKLFLFTLL